MELFNAGKYFQCHDVFEELWISARGEEKIYYQGIIQLAVALYKIVDEPNWRGATSLLTTGSSLLKSVNGERAGIDIKDAVDKAETLLASLEKMGPERMGEIKREGLFKLNYRQQL